MNRIFRRRYFEILLLLKLKGVKIVKVIVKEETTKTYVGDLRLLPSVDCGKQAVVLGFDSTFDLR